VDAGIASHPDLLTSMSAQSIQVSEQAATAVCRKTRSLLNVFSAEGLSIVENPYLSAR
jgi:hypothetical protein